MTKPDQQTNVEMQPQTSSCEAPVWQPRGWRDEAQHSARHIQIQIPLPAIDEAQGPDKAHLGGGSSSAYAFQFNSPQFATYVPMDFSDEELGRQKACEWAASEQSSAATLAEEKEGGDFEKGVMFKTKQHNGQIAAAVGFWAKALAVGTHLLAGIDFLGNFFAWGLGITKPRYADYMVRDDDSDQDEQDTPNDIVNGRQLDPKAAATGPTAESCLQP